MFHCIIFQIEYTPCIKKYSYLLQGERKYGLLMTSNEIDFLLKACQSKGNVLIIVDKIDKIYKIFKNWRIRLNKIGTN